MTEYVIRARLADGRTSSVRLACAWRLEAAWQPCEWQPLRPGAPLLRSELAERTLVVELTSRAPMDRASLLVGLAAAALGRAPAATAQAGAPPAATPAAARTVALVNGQWFNGRAFEPRTVYSVAGRFTATRPARVDTTVDLAGTWVVPPFGEAHDHAVDGGVEGRTRAALAHGYEASVLALGGDPLADIANVRQIRLRFKQGVLLGR